jgi:hypothetical protein
VEKVSKVEFYDLMATYAKVHRTELACEGQAETGERG